MAEILNLTENSDSIVINGQLPGIAHLFGGAGDDRIEVISYIAGVSGDSGNDTLINTGTNNVPHSSTQLLYYNDPGNLTINLAEGWVLDGYGFKDTVIGFSAVHTGIFGDRINIQGSSKAEYFYIGGGSLSTRGPSAFSKQIINLSGGFGEADIIHLGHGEFTLYKDFSELVVYFSQGPNSIAIDTSQQIIRFELVGGNNHQVRLKETGQQISIKELTQLASVKFGATSGDDVIDIYSGYDLATIQGRDGNDTITIYSNAAGILSERGHDTYINKMPNGYGMNLFYLGDPYNPANVFQNNIYVNLARNFAIDEWGFRDRIESFESIHIGNAPLAYIIGDDDNNYIYLGGNIGPRKVFVAGGAGFDKLTLGYGITDWISTNRNHEIIARSSTGENVYDFIEISGGQYNLVISDDIESIEWRDQSTNSTVTLTWNELLARAKPSSSPSWFTQLSSDGSSTTLRLSDYSSAEVKFQQESVSNSIWRISSPSNEYRVIDWSRIQFSDATIALDTDGVAGQAYRIYKAAFNRTPDSEGLGYWIANMDAGLSVVEVSARFIDSAEFRSLYGSNPSNADFLTKVYSNVLGRAPDPSGYAWWLNEMNTNPARTKAKVLADFAESPENISGTSQAISNGISFAAYSGPTITPTPPEPTYTLSSVASANEGDTIVFTVLGENAAAGTSLPYTLSGISAQDLSSGSLTGNLVLDGSAKATLSLTFANDQITEGTETLTLTVAGKTQSVSIQDTSTTPPAPPANPTYSLSVNQTTANEGDTLIFTLNTQNVPQGTVLQYEVTGVSGTDIVGAQLFGQVLVPNTGQARFSITLAQDDSTEGNETLRLSIANQFAEILIRDTSTGVVGQPGGGTDDGGGGGGGGGG